LSAVVSAMAVAAAGTLVFSAYDFGPQSTHMVLHIAAMNVAAPLAAAALSQSLPRWIGRYRTLWIAAALQLTLLWAWHAPSVQHAFAGSHGSHLAAHGLLFLSSFVFWSAVIRLPETGRWQAIAALLVTGKLACLLSALLIFSPRALYDISLHPAPPLDDQQLAGLLMITACPLSYLIAAVVIAAQFINRLAQASRPTNLSTG
jgi:putative membrane protein